MGTNMKDSFFQKNTSINVNYKHFNPELKTTFALK